MEGINADLSAFDVDVKYQKDSENGFSDFLSRNPLFVPDVEGPKDEALLSLELEEVERLTMNSLELETRAWSSAC